MLRYERAVTTVTSKYEDWMDTLKNGDLID
jgi:hypothetical protein